MKDGFKVFDSDMHVLEPVDLWERYIDPPFRDRAPRMGRVDGADAIVVEQGQGLSGIGLLSNRKRNRKVTVHACPSIPMHTGRA